MSRRNYQKDTKYESEFVRELQRKVLHTDPLFLVEVNLLPSKTGGSHKVKLTQEAKALVDIRFDFDTIDYPTIYRIIAKEFGPMSIACLLNRYLQKGNKDLRSYINKLCSNVDEKNFLNTSCLKINEYLVDDIGILLPQFEPKNILDVNGSDVSIKELAAAYPKATIVTTDVIKELPNDKFDLIVISQFLHHCTNEEINTIIKYSKQHLTDDGYVFVREIDINNHQQPIADLIHDLHYYLIGNTDQRPNMNYLSKERLLDLFDEFNLVAESQHGFKYNPLNSFSLAFEM